MTSLPIEANSLSEIPTGWPVAHVAQRVGVSVSTLHSWERRHALGPSLRTTGGHRRYTAIDIAGLLRLRQLIAAGMPTAAAAAAMRRTSAAQPHPAEHAGSGQAALRYAQSASTLDATGLASAAQDLLQESGAQAAWTEVFAPHLQGLGEHWADTGVGVECEHVTSSVLQAVLTRYTAEQQHRNAGHGAVLLAALDGERHVLPLYALAAALAERGLDSRVVGDLPPSSLRAAVISSAAPATLLWAHQPQPKALAALRGLLTVTAMVAVAGPGWPQPGHLPDAVPLLTDLADAVDVLAAWTPKSTTRNMASTAKR